MLEKARASLLPPLGKQLLFERGCCGRVSLLHRHMAIGWYAFGVSWLNFRVVGMV